MIYNQNCISIIIYSYIAMIHYSNEPICS